MKHCPECNKNYADATLSFCLNDGAPLLFGAAEDEPETALLPGDLKSEAATRTFEPASTSGRSQNAADRRSITVAAAIFFLAAIAAGSYFYIGRGSVRQIDSVAVMPFINQGGNPDVEYLSDGMTETLISSLTHLPDLAVKPRSSVFRYKGKDADAKTIGKELNVAAILNGTVVQRGSDIALHVELIDTASETLIWSRDYKRPVANLVALQSEITRDVVDKLKINLSGAEAQKLAKNYTENGEAYQLYLQGRSLWRKQTNKDVAQSIEYFQRAIVIDPGYALAYSGLADAYSLNLPGANRELMTKARAAAQKALELDGNLAEARASLGRILSIDDYDFAGAERELRAAISLAPNYGNGHYFLAGQLGLMGRFEEAFAEHERALELEPLSADFYAGYGLSLLLARRYDEATARLNRALELEPNFPAALGRLSIIAEMAGKYAECVELRAKALESFGNTREAALVRENFARGGREGFYRSYIVGKAGAPNMQFYYLAAVAYSALNEKDMAFDALDKSYQNHEIFLIQFLKNDQRLDPLRDDPRFHDLMKRIGFAK